MKTLYLVRHAKAVSRNLGLADFERALIPRGENDARNLAAKLKDDGVAVDLMISSPANRALLTAHIFADELGYPAQKILLKDEIYDASGVRALLRLIRELDDNYHAVMLCGHNPALEDFAHYLLGGFSESIPTCGVVAIKFQKQYWRNVAKGAGALNFFLFPLHKSGKASATKNLTADLAEKINQQTFSILQNIDAAAAEKCSKSLQNFSAQVARRFMKELQAYKMSGESLQKDENQITQ
jgi:phosphohistidine phosphatase